MHMYLVYISVTQLINLSNDLNDLKNSNICIQSDVMCVLISMTDTGVQPI